MKMNSPGAKFKKLLAVCLAAVLLFAVGSIAVYKQSTSHSTEVLSKAGSRGEEVRQIQTKLKSKGMYSGSVDGIYGTLTKDAVKKFQKSAGLTVETVVLLSHKKPDGHINVKVEFGEGEGKVPLDNIAKRAEEYKPKERVTYKMIKEYIEAKYGFKVHTAYIAEVKRDLGLPMYDAPNAVEELKQSRKHPTAEKVEAIKDALKHFEVI